MELSKEIRGNKHMEGKKKLKSNIRRQKFKRNLPLHFMLIPGVVLVFVYNYLPMAGIIMAFQDFRVTRGIFRSEWVGLEQFRYLFSLPNTSQVIYNTVFIAGMKIILGLAVPIIFALLINEIRSRGYLRFIQTIVYLPHFLSWVILGGIFVTILSPSTGIVNQILNWMGFESRYFLGDNTLFPWTLIITDTWKTFGYSSIIYMAALASVDTTLYESIAIDGGGKIRQLIHITLPGIAPIIFVMAILSLGNILNAGFDQVFNLYSPRVYASGDIIDTLVYRLGLEQAQYSLSTAVGLFKSLISFVLISISYYLAENYGDYQIF